MTYIGPFTQLEREQEIEGLLNNPETEMECFCWADIAYLFGELGRTREAWKALEDRADKVISDLIDSHREMEARAEKAEAINRILAKELYQSASECPPYCDYETTQTHCAGGHTHADKDCNLCWLSWAAQEAAKEGE